MKKVTSLRADLFEERECKKCSYLPTKRERNEEKKKEEKEKDRNEESKQEIVKQSLNLGIMSKDQQKIEILNKHSSTKNCAQQEKNFFRRPKMYIFYSFDT